MRRLLLALAVALAAAPVGPSAAGAAPVVGIADQQAGAFSDPRLRALGLRHARLIVPWDAATSEPDRVAAWLAAVAAAGKVPHVAFQHLRSDDCPSSPCVVPSRARYRAAVEAFRARFPHVTTYTTWNEANHRSQPTATRPEMAAAYYEELRAACGACTIVAGDVLDSGGYVTWLQRFRAATDLDPRLWGLHNYGDVTYGRTTGTDAVLATVPGEVWVEETGGIVTLRNDAGRATLTTNEQRAASAIDRAFELARGRPRITRMYLYHWRGHTSRDPFDAGLVRPDGSERPSYGAVVRQLAADRVGDAIATPAAPAVPRWTVAWSGVRRRQLLVRATCRAADDVCRGKVTVVLRTRAKKHGRWVAKRIEVRTYVTRTTRKGRLLLRANVPKRYALRARRAVQRRIALTVVPTRPAGRRAVVVRTLRRPAARDVR